MHFIQRYSAVVTTILGATTVLSLNVNALDQSPPILPRRTDNQVVERASGGPVFQPPGTPNSSRFQCDYSAMGSSWVACNGVGNRGCWLRNTATGEEYNIKTDYEAKSPTGTTRTYEIDIKDGSWDADGLQFPEAKLFGLANNPSGIEYTYPGPWIEACWGDTIEVKVTNSMRYNGTSVHWHGVRQFHTNQMDGVNGVTQCPTAPGDFFTYKFAAMQYGSSWYHSHYSVQYADGAAGPLTIHGPTSSDFDEDISPPLIINDWGHNSAFNAIITGLENQDILLNGRGNITKYTNGATENRTAIQEPYTVTVQQGKKYLMRIINTSFQTAFVFSIDNHEFTVVEADFTPIEPYKAHQIIVGIGQRYDIILDATPVQNTQKGPFWIRTYISTCYDETVAPAGTTYTEAGILRYDDSSAYPTTSSWSDISTACRDEQDLVPVVPWTVGSPSNSPATEGEVFGIHRNAPFSYPLSFFNLGNVTSPSIRVDYDNITFFNFDYQGPPDNALRIQREDYNAADWIYMVITSGGNEHPIHLHGHDFAILQRSPENTTFDPSTVSPPYNNPPRRDVVTIPKAGYVLMAFRADNPGVWLLHCHIAFHIARGMGMQILEDQEAAAALWQPQSSVQVEARRVCKNWASWSSNPSNWAPQPECFQQHPDDLDQCFQNDSGV